jgi:hypothetical protein
VVAPRSFAARALQRPCGRARAPIHSGTAAVHAAAAAAEPASAPPLPPPPPPGEGVWRPSLDDVQRISQGDAARHRGTGSRAVPHRLNAEERKQYDLAKAKGVLTIAGSGYRRERKGAPLANIYRQWCDARGQACVVLAKGPSAAAGDAVLVDLSVLRMQDVGAVSRRPKSRRQQRACLCLPPSALLLQPPAPDPLLYHAVGQPGSHSLTADPSLQHRQACREVAARHGVTRQPDSAVQSPFTVILPAPLIDAMLAAGGSDGGEVGGLGGGTATSADGGASSSGSGAAEAEDGAEEGSVAAQLAELRGNAPIWQQPPQLEAFVAQRGTAKALAKELAEQLGCGS